MGKMKEIWAAMREKEMYEMEYGIPQEPIQMDILCPNCMQKKLMFNTSTDIKCSHDGCGHKFILVDANTVRFK
jgi:ribosomal protein S27E